jgi:hypothetical protein
MNLRRSTKVKNVNSAVSEIDRGWNGNNKLKRFVRDQINRMLWLGIADIQFGIRKTLPISSEYSSSDL